MMKLTKNLFELVNHGVAGTAELVCWRGVRFCALVGLVWLFVGCGARTLAPYSTPDPDPTLGPDPAGEVTRPFGVVGPGESVDAKFATTVPGEVEDDPRLVLDVTFLDALTGAELIGDVEVFKRGGGDSVSCRQQLRCLIGVRPTARDSAPWVIEIRAVGYVKQELELKGNTLSSRTITMPVQMRPLGLDG